MTNVFVSWLEGGDLPTPAPMRWPEEGPRLPLAEAVLLILFHAVASDGVSTPAESELLQSLTRRWLVRKVLREKSITALHLAALGHLSREGALREACAVIPPALRGAVFANAVDICLSDGLLKREEAVFLDDLIDALGLLAEEAKHIGKVIAQKNVC